MKKICIWLLLDIIRSCFVKKIYVIHHLVFYLNYQRQFCVTMDSMLNYIDFFLNLINYAYNYLSENKIILAEILV
jgi:hypothetical protein